MKRNVVLRMTVAQADALMSILTRDLARVGPGDGLAMSEHWVVNGALCSGLRRDAPRVSMSTSTPCGRVADYRHGVEVFVSDN